MEGPGVVNSSCSGLITSGPIGRDDRPVQRERRTITDVNASAQPTDVISVTDSYVRNGHISGGACLDLEYPIESAAVDYRSCRAGAVDNKRAPQTGDIEVALRRRCFYPGNGQGIGPGGEDDGVVHC